MAPSSATAPETLTLAPGFSARPAYLLIFDGDTTARFVLPPAGAVLIGRDPQVAICLKDAAASRQHARLDLALGEVRITDLGSHNGTRVNGEPLLAPRALLSGDIIGIGEATLVLHRQAPPRSGPPALDQAQLLRRLEEELNRGLQAGRPVTLLCLHLGALPGRDRHAAQAALHGHLDPINPVAWAGAAELLVVLPELHEDQVEARAQRLLAALQGVAPGARAGVATCPADGSDGDALLTGARAAAAAAAPGTVAGVAATTTTLVLGERTVVVAEPAMARLYALLQKLASSALPVLVWGETGVGKELAAAALHHLSPRRALPLLAVNCAALPEALAESELFGHVRGAFTGAVAERRGLLESAAGGTVFLDEIGELPLAVQAKLLRVLETRRFTRVGEGRERSADFRLVAATNRDLEQEVRAGRFRKDLLYRLNAAQVLIPPLRDRHRELPVLARALLREACARAGRPEMTLTAATLACLARYEWPGNVRELRNVMDYAVSVAPTAEVEPWHLPEHVEAGPAPEAEPEREAAAEPERAEPAGAAPPLPRGGFRPIEEELRELERSRMVAALAAAGGLHRRAAELISMPRRTFAAKVKLYGLREVGGRRGG